MDEHDLVEVARRLVAALSAPEEATLRRALSTAYFALFHALAPSNANALIGERNAGNDASWVHVYRALDHGPAKERCRAASTGDLGESLQRFAKAFVVLQKKRHDADYNPRFVPSRDVYLDLIEVHRSSDALMEAPLAERRAFAAFVLLKERP